MQVEGVLQERQVKYVSPSLGNAGEAWGDTLTDECLVWIVQAEALEKDKEMRRLQATKSAEEERIRREAMRKEAGLSTDK